MRIHWLSFTVHSSYASALELWDMFFAQSLGKLISTERRGRGFDHIAVAMNEAKLYYEPIQQKDKVTKDYYHVELTGEACDCLHPSVYQRLFQYLAMGDVRYSISRLDIAFDFAPFEPIDFYYAIAQGWAVTLAKRETLVLDRSPFKRQDENFRNNGEPLIGCDTVYLGSAESNRFVRVYNKRGFTRVEFVCKDERAQVVAVDIFNSRYVDWERKSKAHLLQYICFIDDRFVQWHEFMQDIAPTDIKVSSARVVSIQRMKEWYARQIAVSLSVYYDVWGRFEADRHIQDLMKRARQKDRSRYQAVLELANKSFSKAGVSAFARHALSLGFEVVD